MMVPSCSEPRNEPPQVPGLSLPFSILSPRTFTRSPPLAGVAFFAEFFAGVAFFVDAVVFFGVFNGVFLTPGVACITTPHPRPYQHHLRLRTPRTSLLNSSLIRTLLGVFLTGVFFVGVFLTGVFWALVGVLDAAFFVAVFLPLGVLATMVRMHEDLTKIEDTREIGVIGNDRTDF
jgi:hypothetical protein